MRAGAIVSLLLFLSFFVFIDWSVLDGLQSFVSSEAEQSILSYVYWSINLLVPALLIFSLFRFGRDSHLTASSGSLFIALLIPKLIFLFFFLIGSGLESISPATIPYPTYFAAGLALFVFLAFLYGITRGKYKYTLHEQEIYYEDLPAAFDGFTITQISDIHSGGFHNKSAVEKGIQLVNDQKSDLFVFTGDLVNNAATEIEPWIPSFKKIKAPFGQFSILGNHDYGDYVAWPNEVAKHQNLQRLFDNHKKIGFRLLMDEHLLLEKEGQSIALLGVENWGVGFGKRGNLSKALQDLPKDQFKILLSHDPSHWDHEVKNNEHNIHLTLSGHTHGMQMGFELFGFKWSPSVLRYKKWAGLFEENGRYLYINRGFGFLGFAGRVGIWPEVTKITLRKKK